MQTPERRQTPSVLFDTSIEDGIDQVLALAMVLAYESKREARILSLSVSRNNLKLAAFCELLGRFYKGERPGESTMSRTSVSIGMSGDGTTGTTVRPMISSVLGREAPNGKPLYGRTIEKLNDTADPVALIRNALSAQQDQMATIILAGPPVNLLGLLALPGARQLIQKKVRALVIGTLDENAPGLGRLFTEWPGPVISPSEEVRQSLRFPGNSIEQDFAWAPNHPVVDAYRSADTMPYDAPASAMAAVLYAVHPEESYFKLSEPAVTGQHRKLMMDAQQKDRAVEVFRQIVSSKPPEGRGAGTRGTP